MRISDWSSDVCSSDLSRPPTCANAHGMFALLLVMIGGALGAGARHLVGKWTLHALGPGYPWGILTVNLVGGFVMGLLAGFLMRQSVSHENFRQIGRASCRESVCQYG